MALRCGRYETLREIASGGMATVYLARALGTGGFERLVAIKQMHPHLAQEAEFVAMFLDEARLAARVRHPNVVATIDIQQDEEGLFLVMEYVEGLSLQRLLRSFGKRRQIVPLDLTLRIFLDSLTGLHAAHELTSAAGEPMRLVHRDVSPHNVLIGIDGISRITDFGVARADSRLSITRAGLVKGKLPYLAPEQIRAEPIDRRMDVYAAGVVLWEMLTGERLIWGDNEAEMMRKIVAGEHSAPSLVRGAVPESISAVCMRALCLSPEERYPTAFEFAEALELAATNERLPIATSRIVASAILRLNPAERSPDANASSSSPRAGTGGTPSSASKPSGVLSPSGEIVSSELSSVPSGASSNPSVRTPLSTPAAGSVLDPHAVTPLRRVRKGVLLGISASALILGAIWLLLGSSLRVSWGTASGEPFPQPSASSLAAGAGASAARPAPLPTETAAPLQAAPSSIAPAAEAPSASASSKASKDRARPSQGSPSDRPPPSPTSFRPKEL